MLPIPFKYCPAFYCLNWTQKKSYDYEVKIFIFLLLYRELALIFWTYHQALVQKFKLSWKFASKIIFFNEKKSERFETFLEFWSCVGKMDFESQNFAIFNNFYSTDWYIFMYRYLIWKTQIAKWSLLGQDFLICTSLTTKIKICTWYKLHETKQYMENYKILFVSDWNKEKIVTKTFVLV